MKSKTFILLFVLLLAACQTTPAPQTHNPATDSYKKTTLTITATPVDAGLITTPTQTQPATQTPTHPAWPPPAAEKFPTPTLTPVGFPFEIHTKEPIISLRFRAGDGGGCMGDYLGWEAPTFVLYSDGQLLMHNPDENPWYSEIQLSSHELEALLDRIENTGFFSVIGDGYNGEDDPIYQLPEEFDDAEGAGYISFEVHKGDLSKRVSIYDPWLDYVVPAISDALEIIWDYQPEGMLEYQPAYWVAWFDDEEPCGYPMYYKHWSADMPDIRPYLNGAEKGKLVFQNDAEDHMIQVLGSKPDTFFYLENGVIYYIITRPLLPHELPSDFTDY